MAAVEADAAADLDFSNASSSDAAQLWELFCAALRLPPPEERVDEEPPKKRQRRSKPSVVPVTEVSEDDYALVASVDLRIVSVPLLALRLCH